MSPNSNSSFSSVITRVKDSLRKIPEQLIPRIGSTEIIRHEVTGHIFANIDYPRGFTKCSECDNWFLVFQIGKKCVQCKLFCHENCLKSLKFRCAKTLERASSARHCFQATHFEKLTYCDHCGRLIEGIFTEQGKRCGHGKDVCMNIHYDCEKFISRPCRFRKDTNVSMKDFEFIDLIGSGSSGVVHLVKLKKNDKEKFALKVIAKATVKSDPESIMIEKKVLQFGEYHPFLTRLHCCFQTEERLYFVMEYVDGENLFVHLQKERKFSEFCTKFYSAQIALAIAFLHSKGVVHRDIKLENVIINKDGYCKLIDYGLARFLDQTVDMKDTAFCGTPYYMSPEMIESRYEDDKSYSLPCDWWSLGVLMYELLFGFLPFNMDRIECNQPDELYREICNGKLFDMNLSPVFLTQEAQDILRGLLTKSPTSRFDWGAIKYHPFFKFKARDDGSLKHQWDEIEERLIQWPSRQAIDKIERPNSKPPPEIINDVNTENNLSGSFRGFAYMSTFFESKLLNIHSFDDSY